MYKLKYIIDGLSDIIQKYSIGDDKTHIDLTSMGKGSSKNFSIYIYMSDSQYHMIFSECMTYLIVREIPYRYYFDINEDPAYDTLQGIIIDVLWDEYKDGDFLDKELNIEG